MPGPKHYYDHRAGRMKPTGQGRLQARHGLTAIEGGRPSRIKALLGFLRSVFRPTRRRSR